MKVALLGAGTVGQSVLRLIRERAAELRERSGEPLEVRHVVVLHPERPRRVALPEGSVTTDGLKAVTDPEVDVVIEVIGGIEPAREWVLAALRGGRPVVTANKALVAECGPELWEAADRGGTDLFFEAAAAAAVPIIRALKLSLAGQRVVALAGILNGSTNFLLDALSDGVPADQAVARAQELGYLEADPSDDLLGRDAGRKLAILASIAFSRRVLPMDVPTLGVNGLEPEDLGMARRLGRRVKLLAEAEEGPEGISLRVGPALIGADQPLAHIRGSANAVWVLGDPGGETLMAGLGAGGDPTAVAILGDLIEAVRLKRTGGRAVGCTCSRRTPLAAEGRPRACALSLAVEDRPGVLAAITRILAGAGLSVRNLGQEPRPDGAMQLSLLLHPAPESRVRETARALAQLSSVRRTSPVLPLWEPPQEREMPALLRPLPIPEVYA